MSLKTSGATIGKEICLNKIIPQIGIRGIILLWRYVRVCSSSIQRQNENDLRNLKEKDMVKTACIGDFNVER